MVEDGYLYTWVQEFDVKRGQVVLAIKVASRDFRFRSYDEAAGDFVGPLKTLGELESSNLRLLINSEIEALALPAKYRRS